MKILQSGYSIYNKRTQQNVLPLPLENRDNFVDILEKCNCSDLFDVVLIKEHEYVLKWKIQ
eukprot:UN03301